MRKSNLLSAALAAALIYSPWTKDCPKGNDAGCVLTSEARRENGDFVASAMVVVKKEAGALPVLRVGLPLGVLLFKGVSAAVDKNTAAAGTYTVCLPSGCLADVEPSEEFLDQLKKGRSIALRWSDRGADDASCEIPLDGFAQALANPPGKRRQPTPE